MTPFIITMLPVYALCFAACLRINEGYAPVSRAARAAALTFMLPITLIGLLFLVARGYLASPYPKR